MEKGALPPRVEPAAILTLPAVRLVGTGREIQVLPIAVRLIGLGAGTADFRFEQTRDGEGIVPHQFGFDAPPALAGQLAIVGIAAAQVLRRR